MKDIMRETLQNFKKEFSGRVDRETPIKPTSDVPRKDKQHPSRERDEL